MRCVRERKYLLMVLRTLGEGLLFGGAVFALLYVMVLVMKAVI